MSTIEKSIEVNVSVNTAYNQWTQFEEFPNFMEGIEEVTQLDERRLHWRAEIGGKTKEWTAEIIEQLPDQRIAWRSISGPQNAGVVTFHPIADDKTKIMLHLEYDPEGFIENAGDTFGLVSWRVSGDLERFKEFIEARGKETSGWREHISPNR